MNSYLARYLQWWWCKNKTLKYCNSLLNLLKLMKFKKIVQKDEVHKILHTFLWAVIPFKITTGQNVIQYPKRWYYQNTKYSKLNDYFPNIYFWRINSPCKTLDTHRRQELHPTRVRTRVLPNHAIVNASCMPENHHARVRHPLRVNHHTSHPRADNFTVGFIGSVVAVENLVADARPRHASVRRVAREFFHRIALIFAVRFVAREHVDAAELVGPVGTVGPAVADEWGGDAAAWHFAAELVGQAFLKPGTTQKVVRLITSVDFKRNCRWWKIFWYVVRLFIMSKPLKEPKVIETRKFPAIGYALITAKTQVKIYFVH